MVISCFYLNCSLINKHLLPQFPNPNPRISPLHLSPTNLYHHHSHSATTHYRRAPPLTTTITAEIEMDSEEDVSTVLLLKRQP
ncbi:hypothetical protein HanIR_Chr13g0626021 [Helianthus annuus]|nr:hypothetical protein HanIR_Chr13g0626021 [Helianthus annuus]